MIILKKENTIDNAKIITELHNDKFVFTLKAKYYKKLYPTPIYNETDVDLYEYEGKLIDEFSKIDYQHKVNFTTQEEYIIKSMFALSATDAILHKCDNIDFTDIKKDKTTGIIVSKQNGNIIAPGIRVSVSITLTVEPKGDFELSVLFSDLKTEDVIKHKEKTKNKKFVPYGLCFNWKNNEEFEDND